jgi:hypothetical protein
MCPNPPEAVRIALHSGHEIKLGGDTGEGCGGAIPPRCPRHGRGHGETGLSNLRHPITHDTPITMAKGCGNEADADDSRSTCPATEPWCIGRAGVSRALHPKRLVPSVVRHVKGSKGHLQPHKTCDMSNAGTGASSSNGRSADDQCWHRGREAVVAVGVTSHRGCGQCHSRAKGLSRIL